MSNYQKSFTLKCLGHQQSGETKLADGVTVKFYSMGVPLKFQDMKNMWSELCKEGKESYELEPSASPPIAIYKNNIDQTFICELDSFAGFYLHTKSNKVDENPSYDINADDEAVELARSSILTLEWLIQRLIDKHDLEGQEITVHILLYSNIKKTFLIGDAVKQATKMRDESSQSGSDQQKHSDDDSQIKEKSQD